MQEVPTYDRRAGTVLGWLFGASLGLVIDYAAAATVGESYPAGGAASE